MTKMKKKNKIKKVRKTRHSMRIYCYHIFRICFFFSHTHSRFNSSNKCVVKNECETKISITFVLALFKTRRFNAEIESNHIRGILSILLEFNIHTKYTLIIDILNANPNVSKCNLLHLIARSISHFSFDFVFCRVLHK